MPGNSTTSQGKLTVLKINDFTAGIVSQAYSVNPESVNSPTPGGQPLIFSRVPNAGNKISSSPYTYGCLCLQNGGLLLGPTVFSNSARNMSLPTGSTQNPIISGVLTTQDLVQGADNRTYFTLLAINGGATKVSTGLYTYFENNAPTLETSQQSSNSSVSAALTAQFPFTTILSNGSNFQQLILWSIQQGSDDLGVIYWNSSVGPGLQLSGSTDRNGYAYPANGRVCFAEAGIVITDQGIADVYNAISYTNPTTTATATNLTLGTQYTLIDYDDPASMGAVGTVTSGETLVVKSFGGGLIISGDIFSPTITKAPAVPGTNGLQCSAAITPVGLVYRSQKNGIWAWSGGSSATKLSQNLSDAAFNPNTNNNSDIQLQLTSFISLYYANVQYFQNHIWFDNGYFFNLDTFSWWRLPPYLSPTQAIGKIYANTFYAPRNNYMYQDFDTFYADKTMNHQLQVTSYAFDVTWNGGAAKYAFTPPTGYFGSFWESNPIQLANDDYAEVQDIEIVMQGSGTLTVTALGLEGTPLSNPQTVTVANTNGFGRVRLNAKFQTDVLILQVGWTNAQTPNSGPYPLTPIIESIEVKYRATFPVPVAN